MYGPTRQPHKKVLRIDGPSGERIEDEDLDKRIKDYSDRRRTLGQS
jgi:hypothetical protein